MTDALIGARLQIEYDDHNESFAAFLPVSGTVTDRCTATTGPDDWYLVQLDTPLDYQHRIGPHFQFERLVISRVLVRSRWADEPLSRSTSPSVFLLLVADDGSVDCDHLDVDDFIFACWARCRVSEADARSRAGRLRGGFAMPVLLRAIAYATVFISLVLVFLPARLLSRSGIAAPRSIGLAQAAGAVVTLGGALLALWCILSFVVFGRGTPAPFDPPRRLVVRGPYAWVRNPMYLGAGVALLGASLFYESLALLGYAAVFFVVTHLFVVVYEEPTLRATFGADYEAYCRQVGRWLPHIGRPVRPDPA